MNLKFDKASIRPQVLIHAKIFEICIVEYNDFLFEMLCHITKYVNERRLHSVQFKSCKEKLGNRGLLKVL